MSDLSDDAEGIQALTEGGARFAGRNFGKTAITRVVDKACRLCGGRPQRRPDTYDTSKEILVCMTCGQKTEPLKSRQALQTMWNGMN